VKWKFTFWIKQNRSSSTFQRIFNFYIPFISSIELKKYTSYIFVETKVSCCIHWQGEQKYQITNVGVKSNATKWTKLKIRYDNKFKIVLTNGNYKLSLSKTQTWNIHAAKIMSYQVFVRSYFAKGKRPGNSRGEDLCDYCIRAVNYTLHYVRLSH